MPSITRYILFPDEKVLYVAHLHWIVYMEGLAFVIFGGAFGYLAPRAAYRLFDDAVAMHSTRPLAYVGLGFIAIGVLLLMLAYVRRHYTELIITNQRVIGKHGFIARVSFDVMLERAAGADFEQSTLGRPLHYGTIFMRASGGNIAPMYDMAYPQLFVSQLLHVLGHKPHERKSVKEERL